MEMINDILEVGLSVAHVGELWWADTFFNWILMLCSMDLQRESEEVMPANVALNTFGPSIIELPDSEWC